MEFLLSTQNLAIKMLQAHRGLLGTHWRRNTHTCCFPNHNEKSMAKPDRGTTPLFSKP